MVFSYDMSSWGYSGINIMKPRLTPVVKTLLIANAVVFCLQLVAGRLMGPKFDMAFGLSTDFVLKGRIWQVATYMFLHHGLWHLFVNMLLFFFFGPDVEEMLGRKRFLLMYLGCGMLGGVGWLFITGMIDGEYGLCVGASGAVLGVLGAFAAMFPDHLIRFILLPFIAIRARTLIIGIAAFSVLAIVLGGGGIAHAAHVVGLSAGYFWARSIPRWSFGTQSSESLTSGFRQWFSNFV